MTTRTHELKSWPQFFRPIVAGDRRHELRRNDRDFHTGDVLRLREYDPIRDAYTGSACEALVTSLTSREEPCAVSGDGLHPDFCIMTILVTAVSADLAEDVTLHKVPRRRVASA